MPDLVEFLTARYNERHHAAEAAERTGLWADLTWPESCGITGVTEEHILAWSPKAVLADISVKRAHIERYAAAKRVHEGALRLDGLNSAPWPLAANGCNYITTSAASSAAAANIVLAWEDVLRLDASAYAEHPDFDPAWRTDA
jgi:Family of unknown function (DUF6221)